MHEPHAQSAITDNREDRTKVLLALLQINRQEIREWQTSLFQASLWFNTGILGLAAFVHGRSTSSPVLLLFVGLGIGCLGAFYFVFSGVARRAIELSGQDLLKFQTALRLDEPGSYLTGESIYPRSAMWLPQKHVNVLRALNIAICALAILSFVFASQ